MWAWLTVALSRARAQFSRDDDDLRAELRDHLDRLVEEHLARGMAPNEAKRRAHLRLGGVAQIAEEIRGRRRLPWIDQVGRDARYACRVLRRAPAFTATAVLTLAVGIGATTAMVSLVHATLLAPPPYSAPNELVRIFETNPLKRWARNWAAPANYADWRRQNTAFSDIGAYEVMDEMKGSNDVFLAGFGEPQRLQAIGVTGNLLRLLGTPPLLGRTFTDEETYEGHNRVVILSYGLWQALFAGDPHAVGRTISLSGLTYDVVGVMPPKFFFPRRDVQLWYPVGYAPSIFTQARRPHWLSVVARRRPGVSLAQARDDMSAIARRLERAYPDTNTQMGVRLEPFHDSLVGDTRAPLLMLQAAVVVLFLIVCVNLASLQTGRVVERSREMAIRQAVGAGRRRLVAQLMIENGVLSVVGGALGLLLAATADGAIVALGPPALVAYADPRLDLTTVLAAVALTMAAPLVFGVAPAVTAMRSELLNDRSGTLLRRHRSLRDVFVTCEVALAIVLVIGAGLLVRSFSRLTAVDPGFRAEHVLTFDLQLPPARYPDAAARARAVDQLEAQLRALHSVTAAGASTTLALGGFTWSGDATVEGQAAGEYQRELRHESVTPDYFRAMGIPLLHGRFFDAFDTAGRPPLVLVNEALARTYFHTDNPVGRRFTFGRPGDDAPWVTVVGVVGDAKQDGMDAGVQPEAYEPFQAHPMATMAFALRTAGGTDADALGAAARAAVRAVDRDLVATDMQTMDQVVRASVGDERFRTSLAAWFAAAALALAALGIYGVLAYFVTNRAREIGIRLALGAQRASVFWLILRQAVRPVVPGVLCGLIAAFAVTGLLQSLLFEVGPLDVPTYVGTVTLLAGVASVAAAVPALRALRVDPLTSLRQD